MEEEAEKKIQDATYLDSISGLSAQMNQFAGQVFLPKSRRSSQQEELGCFWLEKSFALDHYLTYGCNYLKENS